MHYGWALIFTVLAVVLRGSLNAWLGDYLPFATLYGAVALVVWFGGYRPAIVATVLGCLACDLLFAEPRGAFGFDSARDILGLILYLLSCGIIIGFGEAMRRARTSAKAREIEAQGYCEQLQKEIATHRMTETALRAGKEHAEADSKARYHSWVGINLDLTEQNRAEEEIIRLNRELQRRADELQTILDIQLRIVANSMAAIVSRCSRDLKYLWVSKSYADWIRRPATEIIGRPIVEILGRKAFNHLLPHFEEVLFGRAVRYEQQDHFEGVGPRWINAVYTPTLDAQGVPDGWVAVVVDVTERKRMEESLRESQTRLAAELEVITRLHALSTRLLSADNLTAALDDVLENAIVTCGADFGNIQLYNPQVGALEIVAHRGFRKDFLDYFRTVRVDDASACAQAMQSGERIVIEDVNLDPRYEPLRPVAAAAGYRAVQSTPLKSRKGSILGMLSTHFRAPHRVSDRDQRLLDLYARHAADLMERFRSEEELRQSEQRFARFMHHLPGLAWIKDWQGRYVYANEAAMKVFRCARDELYGKTDDEVFPPETAAQFEQNDRTALQSEAGVQVIETLEHPDGILHHSVVSKFPILGPEGNPALVGGMAIDISDRLRAEKVLAESEERFRQLAENINEVFWMTDPHTTQLLYISPAYERVWKRSCQSLYENPRSFLDAVHPEDQDRVRNVVLEKQSRGEQTDKEYRVVWPDGSIRWV
jgi:PAS domain S-box-containing protein